jgi:uncharacterized protein (DUF1015 family)
MYFKPFDALLPEPSLAAGLIAPPYDVMNTAEARAMVDGKPFSLLRVTRSELALPDGADPYAASVYELARDTLGRLVAEGALRPAGAPVYGVYRLTRGGHQQTGLVGTASVEDYRAGLIRKHEFTRADKEDDRTRHIAVTGAQTGPVFLGCRANASFSGALEAVTARRAPDVDVTAADGVRHEAWWVRETGELEAIVGEMDVAYICDGHHRAASAARVAALGADGGPDAGRFLAVLFSAEQLEILPYNRVVADLAGMDAETFLARLGERFIVTGPGANPQPPVRHRLAMYLAGAWYALAPRTDVPGVINEADPVASLDVAILQDHVLAPLLGITDPRRDKRIDFVGGVRGTAELARRVDTQGVGVAFSLYPTSLDELFRVADQGDVMPPKSTWFEPKLADGMFIHRIR